MFRIVYLFIIFNLCFALNLSYAYAEDQNNDLRNRQEATGPEYPSYTGPKKRVAVTRFDNRVKGTYGSWNIGDAMAEMLTTELIKTGRFIVVERQALQDMLGEQEMGQAGIIKKETAAKVGQVLGAQIIVRGVVSEFQQNESGGGGGIGIGGFGFGLRSSNAHVAVDIRLIDSTTGQVLQSHNAAGKAESSGVGVSAISRDVNFNAASFRNAPIGQATRQAISNAVSFIIATMEKVPFSAKVIKFDKGKVYINAGSSMNIHSGLNFSVYSVGEDIVDPDTGLTLGADEKLIGTVEVQDVQEKYSIGTFRSDTGQIKKGDLLKLQ